MSEALKSPWQYHAYIGVTLDETVRERK